MSAEVAFPPLMFMEKNLIVCHLPVCVLIVVPKAGDWSCGIPYLQHRLKPTQLSNTCPHWLKFLPVGFEVQESLTDNVGPCESSEIISNTGTQ